ncbi:MAG: TonB-dependent receptor, partial [Calditrichaeota bacterium]|nr:TonB-dependent receptor [Calditrichota bacterium]
MKQLFLSIFIVVILIGQEKDSLAITESVLTSSDMDQIPKLGIAELLGTQTGVVRREGSQSLTIRGSSPTAYLDGLKFEGIRLRLSKQMLGQLRVKNQNYLSNLEGSSAVELMSKSGSNQYKFDLQMTSDGTFTSPGGNFSDWTIDNNTTFGNGFKNAIATVSGPILPGNTDHSFIVVYDQIWTNDDRPSFVATNKKSDLESYTLFGKLECRPLSQLETSVAYYRTETDGNPYIHERAFFGDGTGHTMRYEDQSSFLTVSLNYQITDQLKFSGRFGLSSYEHMEGDNRYWNNFGKYGSKELNEFTGDQTDLILARQYGSIAAPGNTATDPGTLNNPFDLMNSFQDIYGEEYHLRNVTAINRVWNQFGKSKYEDTQFNFQFDYQFYDHAIQLGYGMKSSEIRKWFITPVWLTTNDGVLHTDFQRYFLVTAINNFGYDAFGNEVGDGFDYLNGSGDFDNPNLNAAESPGNPLQTWFYLHDTYEYDRFKINLGARIDIIDPNWINLVDPLDPVKLGPDPYSFDPEDMKPSETFTEFQPRLSLEYQFDEQLRFGFSYSKTAIAPNWNYVYTSLYEFYRDFQGAGNTINNPNLNPEIQSTIEFSSSYHYDFSFVKLAYYTIDFTGLIALQRVDIPI